MITYEYKCDNCGHAFEIEQSIKDSPKKKCPECKKHKLERVIFGGYQGIVQREPTTIGQLAEINTKRDRTRLNEEHAKKEESKPKTPEPWYGSLDREKRKKINRMNSNQKFKYIMEGD